MEKKTGCFCRGHLGLRLVQVRTASVGNSSQWDQESGHLGGEWQGTVRAALGQAGPVFHRRQGWS